MISPFENVFTIIGSIVVLIISALIVYFHHVNQYFARRNIEFIKPQWMFGNAKQLALGKANLIDLSVEWYKNIKGRYGGVWVLLRPTIVVKDLDLARLIFVKDFEYFSDRGIYVNEENDPLTANLVALSGERWKFVRNKLSPAFTSGKLKQMVPNIWKISERLQEYIATEIESGTDVFDIRELLRRYTIDIITTVAFGAETNSINNKNDMFRVMSERMLKPSTSAIIKSLMSFFFPSFVRKFKIKTVDQDIENFMRKIVEDTVHVRESEQVVRQDFMQLLVQLRNNTKISDDDKWDAKVVENNLKTLSVNEIMAQVFIFFVGGFETTSTAIAMSLFELAKNAEIQSKLQTEIDEVLERFNGQWTYESVSEMKYLDQIVSETLRLYPPGTMAIRDVKKTYKVPNSNDTFIKGDSVSILIHAIQTDEQYFKDPLKYDPERFSPENKQRIVPGSYMPFGDGPRNCIGMRLALLKTKIGIAAVCSKFTAVLAPGRKPDFKLKAIGAWDMVDGNMLQLSHRK